MNKTAMRLSLILVVVAIIAACSPQSSTPLSEGSGIQTASTKTLSSATPVTIAEKIRNALAEELGLPTENVQVHTIDETIWQDSCLEAPEAGEICTNAKIQGYGGILITGGILYEFHSDQTAENLRFIPGAALAARQKLLMQLGVDRQSVKIASVKEVTWKNDCLEINAVDQVCTANKVKGYLITLDIDGKTYQFHTDSSGSDVRLAEAPEIAPIDPIISWSATNEFQCEQAIINENQIVFGLCGGPQLAVPLPIAGRSEDIQRFANIFSPFSAETQAGGVALNGTGLITATPSDQRMVAEWAKATMLEAMGGGGDAAWGLGFAWHRVDSLTEACEDVVVYLSGIAEISSCKDGAHADLGKTWLTGNQMWQLYSWIDTYQGFEVEMNDPANAGTSKMRIIFNGEGDQEAGEFEQNKLANLGAELVGLVQTVPQAGEVDKARQALQDYLAALADSQYSEAVHLYGGSYEILQTNNPLIPGDNYPELFQQACTQNGFVCDLSVLHFIYQAQLSDTTIRFTVELMNTNGSLFLLGPCCGANPAIEPPWSQFDFLVQNVDGIFKVMDLPVYMP